MEPVRAHTQPFGQGGDLVGGGNGASAKPFVRGLGRDGRAAVTQVETKGEIGGAVHGLRNAAQGQRQPLGKGRFFIVRRHAAFCAAMVPGETTKQDNYYLKWFKYYPV